jgi:hypothetical protein
MKNWTERIEQAEKRGRFLDQDKRLAAKADLGGILPLYENALPEGQRGLRAEMMGFSLAAAIKADRIGTARIADARLRSMLLPERSR